MGSSYDQPAMLGLQFDFFRELRLFEQTLRHADAPRVADADNASLDDHVTTL
jgi:hypothetical protein